MEEVTAMYDALTALGVQIKELCAKEGWSAAKFARKLDTASPTARTLMTYPRVSIIMLFRVAHLFDQRLVIRLEPRSPRGKA